MHDWTGIKFLAVGFEKLMNCFLLAKIQHELLKKFQKIVHLAILCKIKSMETSKFRNVSVKISNFTSEHIQNVNCQHISSITRSRKNEFKIFAWLLFTNNCFPFFIAHIAMKCHSLPGRVDR